MDSDEQQGKEGKSGQDKGMQKKKGTGFFSSPFSQPGFGWAFQWLPCTGQRADARYTFPLGPVVGQDGENTPEPLINQQRYCQELCTLAVPGSDKLIAFGKWPETLSLILILIPRKISALGSPTPCLLSLCFLDEAGRRTFS